MKVTEKEISVLKANSAPAANILIIEDDKDTAETLLLYLANEGYGVRWVTSRDEALAVLDSYLYDFIVMDNFMPGMQADTFVKEARRRRASSKIILMTATNCVAEEAARLGINSWIGKPFQPDALLTKIREERRKESSSNEMLEFRDRIIVALCGAAGSQPAKYFFGAFKNFIASTHPERSGILPTDRAVLQTLTYMMTTKEIEVTQDGKPLRPDEIQSILSGAFELKPTDVAQFYYKMRR